MLAVFLLFLAKRVEGEKELRGAIKGLKGRKEYKKGKRDMKEREIERKKGEKEERRTWSVITDPPHPQQL